MWDVTWVGISLGALLAYADDITLLSPGISGWITLSKVCEAYATFNIYICIYILLCYICLCGLNFLNVILANLYLYNTALSVVFYVK